MVQTRNSLVNDTYVFEFIQRFSSLPTTQNTLQHLSHSQIYTLAAETTLSGATCPTGAVRPNHSHIYPHTGGYAFEVQNLI